VNDGPPWTEAEIEHARVMATYPDAYVTLCHQFPHRHRTDIAEKLAEFRKEEEREQRALNGNSMVDPVAARTLADIVEGELRRPRPQHKLDE
jgi:hypothetical protein